MHRYTSCEYTADSLTCSPVIYVDATSAALASAALSSAAAAAFAPGGATSASVPWAAALARAAGSSPLSDLRRGTGLYARTIHMCDELGLELELGVDIGTSWTRRDAASDASEDSASAAAAGTPGAVVPGTRAPGDAASARPNGTLCVSVYVPICVSNESGA